MAATTASPSIAAPRTWTSFFSRSTTTSVTPATCVTPPVTATLQWSQDMPATRYVCDVGVFWDIWSPVEYTGEGYTMSGDYRYPQGVLVRLAPHFPETTESETEMPADT